MNKWIKWGCGTLLLITFLITIKAFAANPGDVTTVAGNGTAGYSGDGGSATSAMLNQPWGIALDAFGNIYIADLGDNRIRKVTTSGIISTVAGNGNTGYSGDGGPATSAMFDHPAGLAVDASGNIYIPDTYNHCIRKINTSGIITTVVGTGTPGYSGDGGSATSAMISYPWGVALDASGNIYIADTGSNRIRKVDTSGIISTVAGNESSGYSGDGGPATSAMLNNPWDVAVDASGNIYIADVNNQRIRKVNTSGVISTVAGNGTSGGYSGEGGPATSAVLSNPGSVAVDASGILYFMNWDRVNRVSASGIITTVAGIGVSGYSGDGGPATSAMITNGGIAVDASGNIFIAEQANNRIRKVLAAKLPTISGTPATSVTNGTPYIFIPTSTNTTSFSITNKPDWANFDEVTGKLSGTPRFYYPQYVGFIPEPITYSNIVISAINSMGTASLPAFNITVNPTQSFTPLPPPNATAGIPYSYTFTYPGATSFSISNKPSWANFNTTTGTLSGTPTNADVGSSAIFIHASNGAFVTVFSTIFTVLPSGGSGTGGGTGSGGTQVPVMDGWWLLPGMLAGVGIFARRRKIST